MAVKMHKQSAGLQRECVSQGKWAISGRCFETELIPNNTSTTALTAETALLCNLLGGLLEKSGGSKGRFIKVRKADSCCS